MSAEITYRERFITNKVCVLIPTYNNALTLKHVIDGVLEITSEIIVVNDGSTDETAQILSGYSNLHFITFEKNRGKGKALRTGFKKAVELGYEYAITIDSDGQHKPSELPVFIDYLEKEGPCLIIGARNMNQESVPGKSSFGKKFSNFWFWVETGIKSPDTQSGYRLYPVGLLKNVVYFTHRFEFEIEVIVRAAWKGIKVRSVPVSVYYAPADKRVSHFRPFIDFTRISILNTFLVLIALLWMYPVSFFKSLFKKETYLNLKKEMFNPNESRFVTAASIGFGVFMGIVPIWGFQLLVAIAISIFLKLNKALVIIWANISIPPMIPIIIFLSYKAGALWVENPVPLNFDKGITLETIHLQFIQYVYGAVSLAAASGIIAGVTAYLYLLIFRKKQNYITE